MQVETQIFNNNSIYVYFLTCIVISSYQHFSKQQKLSLIYATTIAMEIFSQYSWELTSVMMIISLFILEEYLSNDTAKCELLSNFWYKLVDFIYQFIFIDAGVFIVINILLSGNSLKGYFVIKNYPLVLFYGINIIILLFTIHKINTLKFELYDFETIKGYFDKFNGKKIKWDDPELQKKFDIMTELEDRSYFDRKNSYNWVSIDFIKYKIREYNSIKRYIRLNKEHKTLFYALKRILRQIIRFRLIRYIINKLRCKLKDCVFLFKVSFLRFKRKIRGCSTLEMQLIRNIGIKKGYAKCIIRRKIFEFFYTYLFFNGLKQYYEDTLNNKRKEYKKFILYVYLHSIKLSVFENDFNSINMLFSEKSVEKWDIDEFYVAILSLTGAPVSPKRIALYPRVVNEIGVDLNRALAWRNLIKNSDLTEEKNVALSEDKVQTVYYVIQNKIIPYIEDGVFYGPNDGENDWPSYEYGDFAKSVYYYIWGMNCSDESGTSDDMLREYNLSEDKTITLKHCQNYLGVAEIGAIITIGNLKIRNCYTEYNRHSQILLSHDQNGITIYESDSEKTKIDYYTWTQYVEKYGHYRYFEFIKWPRCYG